MCIRDSSHGEAGPAQYGPGPIWARGHMGQGPYGPGLGPYGPGPIWARAHWAPGPWAPGPSLLGKHLTKKRTPEKKSQNCVFCEVYGNKKDARHPYDHFGGGIAPRSLLCVRKRRFPFLKARCFCAAKMLFWGNQAARAGGTSRRRWGNRPPRPDQPIPLEKVRTPKASLVGE